MRPTHFVIATALLGAAPGLVAQDGKPAEAAASRPASESLAAIVAEYESVRDRARSESRPGAEVRALAKAFVDRCLAAAKTHAGTEAAMPFYAWAAEKSFGDKERWDAIFTALGRDQVRSATLTDAMHWIGVFRLAPHSPAIHDFVAKVAAESPHASVRADAHYVRAALTVGRKKPEELTEEQRATAAADFARAIELAPSSWGAAHSLGLVHAREQRFDVGQKALEIEGRDLDGVACKLSDHRGKVVLLDFWGDW